MLSTTAWTTIAIFAFTYLGLALGKIPGLRPDRAGIALVGAILILVAGAVPFETAVSPAAVDYETLCLLFGMMVVVGYLRLAHFFEWLAGWALRRVSTAKGLLAATILLSGGLSAFLVNDIVCLALTPLVLHLARKLKCDPVPQLLGLATAANVGSAATITGNPQNMIIGVQSHIPYLRFVARLLPVAVIGLLLTYLLIAGCYRKALRGDVAPAADGPAQEANNIFQHRAYVVLLVKSLVVTVAAVVLFFVGLPVALVALGAAAVLLLFGHVRPEKIYREIDWGLLVMFAGLFIVVYAFKVHVVVRWHIEDWTLILGHPVTLLSVVSAGLSNLVSNVPAVLLFEPVVKAMPAASQEAAWLALALSSTFAGNLTVLGSVANLIVVEHARRAGVAVSFGEYCKVGVPLTATTLTVGIAWLRFVSY
jgi:Na+/H+ antiporter NhaD/arsenite permease-like protein